MSNSKILQSLEYLNPTSLKNFASKFSGLIESKLWAKVLIGMVLGLTVGYLLSPTGIFEENLASYSSQIKTLLNWLSLPAKFFLKLIQMVIVPLIIASIIRGLASTDNTSQMKSLGIKFGLFVIVTSSLSAALGSILTIIFKPGRFLDLNIPLAAAGKAGSSMTTIVLSPETFLNLLPSNPIESIVQGQMMDVVILAIIAGIALLSIEAKQTNTVLNLLEVIQNICMTIIAWAMKIAPYAIFGMMTSVAANTGLKALQSMSFYIMTVFSGFIIFVFFYSMLILIFKKISPFVFFKKIINPILLAFSTSSSAATMPITLKAAEEELNISKSTANFLIPLGTTVNMAGTAIWQTTAVIFLSQVYRIDLGLGEIIFVVATSIGSAVGSPGVPGVGMGILAVVLGKIGIPVEGISLILGVDRIVDMGCTVVNVIGDLTASLLFDTNDSPS
ncbi:dicarboxylate/amino acid:cation symporter [Bacteriovoracaceae bacterium]|nr:dicarboxylate/amino acid:cation symporter [Bacteriovoracaceae bacterium]